MAYLNPDNWEHCEQFINYLAHLHQQEFQSAQQERRQPNRTKLQELLALCQKVPSRSYIATLKNLFSSGLEQCSNDDFVKTIEKWMNDTNFTHDPNTKHQQHVRFGDEYAPNLAYAFEYFINKLKANDDFTKNIPFAESAMKWAQREIFQPRWQKALVLALVLTMTVLSLLSMGGLLPISFFAVSGICMAFFAVGGGALYLESDERNGLFTQREPVLGAENLDLSAVSNFKFTPIEQKNPSQTQGNSRPLFSGNNMKPETKEEEHSLKISAKKK